ncbi:alpha/beta hydrolase [Mycobacteroides abscessus]|uniref:alpha/beta hydrolase n=1 Tax=Mycobacteroides abscessus TaxID=36809 RepID=UPI000C2571BF|nr:alpha/beta fold hydrolase [Mycobacteroides abscessus]
MSNAAARPKRRDIEYNVRDITVRGWLQVPDGPGPHPVVILAHGFGGLKEWTIPELADTLVSVGIAAIAFDYRNFGDSDGSPREEVDHCGQIDDFLGAIAYATTVSELDPARIGLWGTSLGGRNVLAAAAIDSRVKCVVAQVPGVSLSSRLWVDMMLPDSDVATLEAAIFEDQRDRLLGKEPRYVSMDAPPDSEPGSYLITHGEEERRNWRKRISLQSFAPTVVDDLAYLIPKISPKPLLMILAEQEHPALLAGQRSAYAAAGEPKSLLKVDGHHYSVYTDWKDVTTAATTDWFLEHLTPSQSWR